MENYFSFNQKTLASLGVNFEGQGRKFEKPLRMTVAVVILLSTIQSLLFLLTATVLDLQMASAFTVGLYDFYGCFKFFAVTKNVDKLRGLKRRLEVMMKTLSEKQIKENFKFLNRCRKITKTIFVTTLSCIWIFNLLPLVTFIYLYLAKGFEYHRLPFSFWFPFNTTENFFPAYFYEIACGHILTAVPLAIDGIVLLLIGQFTVLFKCHGENISNIINEFNAENREEIVAKLHRAIDLHNELLDMTSVLFGIYAIPLLVNILATTGTLCFIAFICSVRNQTLSFLCLFELFSS